MLRSGALLSAVTAVFGKSAASGASVCRCAAITWSALIAQAASLPYLGLFHTMSVRDNVLTGGHCRNRSGFIANALRLPIVGREQRLLGGRATVLLEMLELTAVADVPVSAVPFWRLKRVELARALAGEPRLLLLDEPAAGLKELQNLLDELAASRASRRSTWRIVQEWRAILKDAAGVEPPAGSQKYLN